MNFSVRSFLDRGWSEGDGNWGSKDVWINLAYVQQGNMLIIKSVWRTANSSEVKKMLTNVVNTSWSQKPVDFQNYRWFSAMF